MESVYINKQESPLTSDRSASAGVVSCALNYYIEKNKFVLHFHLQVLMLFPTTVVQKVYFDCWNPISTSTTWMNVGRYKSWMVFLAFFVLAELLVCSLLSVPVL